MSIVKTYSVFCDVNGPKCRFWIAQTTDGSAEARSEAKASGWKRSNGQDVCPGCQGTTGTTTEEAHGTG